MAIVGYDLGLRMDDVRGKDGGGEEEEAGVKGEGLRSE